MGHLYTKGGALVCDSCSRGTAKQRRCPAGYCPGADLCRECFELRAREWATAHRDCAQASEELREREARARARLKNGESQIRAAWGDWARGVPAGFVRVLAEDARGRRTWFLMPKDMYVTRTDERFPESYWPKDSDQGDQDARV